MITIDGSKGEGGGQIVRTSLSLSLITGKPFTIKNIRAARSNPGLRRQHLASIDAAAQIGGAEVSGADVGSQHLTFTPGNVRAGQYSFPIGTAGSTTLVFQTVLPALLLQPGPSFLTFEGGTHNPMAPPYDYLEKTFIPVINRMGATISVKLIRYGFYPAGGGNFEELVEPVSRERLRFPQNLRDRGKVNRVDLNVLLCDLPEHIARRETETVLTVLGNRLMSHKMANGESDSPGNAVIIEISCDTIRETVSVIGQRGIRAEAVARQAARETVHYLESDACVGPHLADQLLLPLALCGEGEFSTVRPTTHTVTNMETIGKFMEVRFRVEQLRENLWLIALEK
ncbi:MAG: RNA 3'-terminal phosphate cyclase [Fibrobacterota bacterium]